MHPFESAGLGQAPFRCVGISENLYNCGGGVQKPGGCCDYCSNGIRYEYHVVSHDGKQFKVGSDCIRRINSEDNKLLKQAERAKADFDRKRREQARQEAWKRAQEAKAALLQEERARNGGKTNQELAVEQAAAERQARRVRYSAENLWLIRALLELRSDSSFVSSMLEKLAENPASELSERMLEVLCEIYAKAFGRRNSKAYQAAVEEFEKKVHGKETNS